MASLNEVRLIGNLGHDPDVRYTAEGLAIVKFSLATTNRWKDKGGKPREETEWHRVTVMGRQGEVAADYLKKGRLVFVAGRLHTSKYDKDGVAHYSTEIIADTFQMLDAATGKASTAEPEQSESD